MEQIGKKLRQLKDEKVVEIERRKSFRKNSIKKKSKMSKILDEGEVTAFGPGGQEKKNSLEETGLRVVPTEVVGGGSGDGSVPNEIEGAASKGASGVSSTAEASVLEAVEGNMANTAAGITGEEHKEAVASSVASTQESSIG